MHDTYFAVKIAELVEDMGVTQVSEEAGVDRQVIYRILAGTPLSRLRYPAGAALVEYIWNIQDAEEMEINNSTDSLLIDNVAMVDLLKSPSNSAHNSPK